MTIMEATTAMIVFLLCVFKGKADAGQRFWAFVVEHPIAILIPGLVGGLWVLFVDAHREHNRTLERDACLPKLAEDRSHAQQDPKVGFYRGIIDWYLQLGACLKVDFEGRAFIVRHWDSAVWSLFVLASSDHAEARSIWPETTHGQPRGCEWITNRCERLVEQRDRSNLPVKFMKSALTQLDTRAVLLEAARERLIARGSQVCHYTLPPDKLAEVLESLPAMLSTFCRPNKVMEWRPPETGLDAKVLGTAFIEFAKGLAFDDLDPQYVARLRPLDPDTPGSPSLTRDS